eukprot:1145378-Pelagomonas_calceolata.AAC.4
MSKTALTLRTSTNGRDDVYSVSIAFAICIPTNERDDVYAVCGLPDQLQAVLCFASLFHQALHSHIPEVDLPEAHATRY